MKKRRLFWIVIGLALIMTVILLNQQKLRSLLRKGDSGSDLEQIFEIAISREVTDDMNNVAVGDAIYYTEKGRLHAVSLANEPLWDMTMPDQVFLKPTAGKLLVAEAAVGNLYLLDAGGQLLASAIGVGTLDSVQHLPEGYVVTVLNQSREIRVFNGQLQQEARMEIPNGKILNIHVNTEYNRLAALVLEDAEGELRTSVVLYNLKGEALQVINRSEIAISAYSYRDEIIIVGPRGITTYKEMLTRPISNQPLDNVTASHLHQQLIYMQTGSQEALQGYGEPTLTVYSMVDGEIEFSNKLTAKYDKIEMQGNQVLTYTKNNLEIQNASGEHILSKTYPVPIRKAALTAEGGIVLVFADRISLNQLKH